MRYCSECGTGLPKEDAKFCPNCGVKQPVETAPGNIASAEIKNMRAASEFTNTITTPPKPQAKKTSIGKIILAIFGAFVALGIILLFSAIIALFVFGLSDSIDNPSDYSSPSQTPQQVFGVYYNGFKNVNDDAIWGVLSSKAQAEGSKNRIYNTIYTLNSQGLRFSDYTITDIQIDAETAQISASVDLLVNGYKVTKNKNIHFVRENGAWKISNFVIIA